MTTIAKDFKVKNGLEVGLGGSFGGPVVVGTPTSAAHAATKSYVDALVGGIPTGSTPPQSPSNGDLWFDTITQRLNVYYESFWRTIATIDDVLNIPDHIHDTSIGGNGLIVTRFVDAGTFNEPQGTPADAGTPTTTDWSDTWNGGIASDAYN